MEWVQARRRWRRAMVAIAMFFVVLIWFRPTLDASEKVLWTLLFSAVGVAAYFKDRPRRR